MKATTKSKARQITFWISFIYVLLFTTIAFGFHLASFEVISFWPIFSGTIGYLSSLGIANYLSTPKSTDE